MNQHDALKGELETNREGWKNALGACKSYEKDIQALRTEVAALRDRIRELEMYVASINHMGGDERGGYCICPKNNGAAPDERHATVCAEAREIVRTSKSLDSYFAEVQRALLKGTVGK